MTSSVRLRHAARGLLLDERGVGERSAGERGVRERGAGERSLEGCGVLLCRFEFPHPIARERPVWACPGGGVEEGESALEALRRELDEEVGLRLDDRAAAAAPHVWHQVVEGTGQAEGYDGIVNDYFLVRTRRFEPEGSFDAAQLAAENIAAFRWWTLGELEAYDGEALFSPRALPVLLRDLVAGGVPAEPRRLGL